MTEEVELFTTRMRKATRKIHNISDALVNAKFALALRDEDVWGGGLFIFYHIFGFLEDAQERLKMADFDKLFFDKVLYRKKAFEEDLAHYLGENWHMIIKPIALENYIEHLEELERSNPRMLMAYAYHLYLGLLSGGQILAKKRRIFGEENAKPDTYKDKVTDFTGTDIAQLKKDYKKAMNEIAETMSEEEKTAFIEESNNVFVFNNLIVNCVGGQNKVLLNLLYQFSVVVAIVAGIVAAYKFYK
ncbi:hypothetical protein PYW07_010500 [Mythimna separata]|uniref:Heme oxygenase n=1 Tax=Mythimna separata TaxID=271217 RepID=A0AAD8DMB9_MYTSE|nr:hypothetical protein PYW07_010500 [Mythimna separata]